VVCLTTLLFAGCGDRTATGPEGVSGYSAYAPLPPGAYLDSAKLLLHTCNAAGQAVVVHPQQTAWEEATVTWSQIGPGLSPFVLATFRSRDTGWVRVDVTGLLKLWLDGTWANHGILLDQNAPEYLRTEFNSRESGSRAPRLVLYYSIPGSSPVFSFTASGDARIDAGAPLSNFGSDSVLQTGWTTTEPGECRALLAFNLSEEEPAPQSRVGDRVWLDADADGVQDESEAGFAGASVRLMNCEGDVLSETVSDSTGHYRFDSLEAGSYVVSVQLPAGFLFTVQDQGESDAADSDIHGESGRTGCFELGEGEDNLSIDAGVVPEPEPEPEPAAVGDRVWLDLDRDGLQGDGEPGMAGVEVSLLSCEQAVLASTLTDLDGHYRFGELEAGSYRLLFHKPDGFEFSPQVESAGSSNSDADPETGLSECIELAPAEEDMTRDAGLFEPEPEPEPLASLGDRVWLDANRNGMQDEGETRVAGVGVVLKNCEGAFLANTSTDESGHFRFDSLPAGSYRIMFLVPEGFELSPQGASLDLERDSDPDPATASTACIELSTGQVDLSRDAGLCEREVEPAACTRSRCFWKEHSGRSGDPDWVSRHLPIWLGSEGGAKSVLISQADSAGKLLSYCIMGGYFNGIARLYAELLTVRLNEAEGASPLAVQSVVDQADLFLAGTSWKSWCDLNHSQRCQVDQWRKALSDWNEGRTGPGVCPQ